MEEIKVVVTFTIENFTDALHYSLEEFLSKTEEEIEADKQARYEKWKYNLENPPIYEEEQGGE